ncbi:hypothetical protein MPSEU_000091700 [Mayamaea pseudoterrestris]|nr:hypothetical protein MPSEU_000091700 [Mayamaea pseudoterrestris]
MPSSKLISAIVLIALCAATQAFSPSVQKKRSKTLTFQPARTISGSMPRATGYISLRMSDEDKSNTEQKPAPTSGTYYDDEVDPIPSSKQGISETMKQRLQREASAGLDSNSKQTNVILYISAAVIALVLLGGQGILF